jgi:hypothetical protein
MPRIASDENNDARTNERRLIMFASIERSSRKYCLLLTVALAPLPIGRATAREIVGVQNFRIDSRLTGASSLNRTTAVGVGGTDLGHMVNHNGKTYFLFGDTFNARQCHKLMRR